MKFDMLTQDCFLLGKKGDLALVHAKNRNVWIVVNKKAEVLKEYSNLVEALLDKSLEVDK